MSKGRQDYLIGKTVDGRYRIIEKIGRGGTATVYRARDERLERDVAIKVMFAHLAENPAFVESLRREARLAASINHPGIISIYDQSITGDIAYIVMELIEGPSLRTWLEENPPLNLGEALKITTRILEALAVAHRQGLIHRDIKPANVLMGNGQQPKLADFGLTRAVSDATASPENMVIGTAGYLPPEICNSQKATPRSDIYSLGIMLYQLITGELPFKGDTPLAVVMCHMHDTVPPLTDLYASIPAQVSDLVELFTHRDPLQRPADAGEALECLNAVAQYLTPTDRRALYRSPEQLPQPAEETAPPSPLTSQSTGLDLVSETSPTLGITTDSGSNIHSDGDLRSPEQPEYQPEVDKSLETVELGSEDMVSSGHTTAYALGSGATGGTAAGPGVTGKRTKAPADESNQSVIFPAPEKADSANVLDDGEQGKGAVSRPAGKKRRKSSKRIIAYVAAHLLAVAVAVAVVIMLGRVEVPNIVGKSLASAQKQLTDLELKNSVVEENHDQIPQGDVIATLPEAGKSVTKGTVVKLRISAGVLHIKVPDVLSFSKENAVTKLDSVGLTTEPIVEEYDEKVPLGQVVSVTPAVGTQSPHNVPVKLVISKGRKPIELPDFKGKTAQESSSALKELKLTVAINEEFSNTVEKGTVISQSPTEGPLYAGDTVNLTVSKGPDLVAVPNVFGKDREVAKKQLAKAGFQVKEKVWLSGLLGKVRSQSPGAGTQVPRGSTVEIQIV